MPRVREPKLMPVGRFRYDGEDRGAEPLVLATSVEQRGVDAVENVGWCEAHVRQRAGGVANKSSDRCRFRSGSADIANEEAALGGLSVMRASYREDVADIPAAAHTDSA